MAKRLLKTLWLPWVVILILAAPISAIDRGLADQINHAYARISLGEAIDDPIDIAKPIRALVSDSATVLSQILVSCAQIQALQRTAQFPCAIYKLNSVFLI